MKKLFIVICMIGSLSAAAETQSELTIEWLDQATLNPEDIINLLGGSNISKKGRIWKLFGTSFVGDIGHIAEATEIATSDDLDFNWLFYVTTKNGQLVLVLHKLFQSFMRDDRLLIFTPVSDDFAANPWVQATTISQPRNNDEEQHPDLVKLFEPFLKRK